MGKEWEVNNLFLLLPSTFIKISCSYWYYKEAILPFASFMFSLTELSNHKWLSPFSPLVIRNIVCQKASLSKQKNYSLVIKLWTIVSSDITWFQRPDIIKFQIDTAVDTVVWHLILALPMDLRLVEDDIRPYCLLLHFLQVSIHMSSSYWCFSVIPYWKL